MGFGAGWGLLLGGMIFPGVGFFCFKQTFVGSLLSFTALAVTELFSSVTILTAKNRLKLDASEFLEKPI